MYNTEYNFTKWRDTETAVKPNLKDITQTITIRQTKQTKEINQTRKEELNKVLGGWKNRWCVWKQSKFKNSAHFEIIIIIIKRLYYAYTKVDMQYRNFTQRGSQRSCC